MAPMEHVFAGVTGPKTGQVGKCSCGWDTGVLPDPESWNSLADHMMIYLRPLIEATRP